VITFCPSCWAELAEIALTCPFCGVDLADVRQDYGDKLIAALRHPEPLTQRRAAYLLGLRAESSAVQPLMEVMDGAADVYVRAEAACALAKIGGAISWAKLEHTAADKHESFIVRRVAEQWLANRHLDQEDVNARLSCDRV